MFAALLPMVLSLAPQLAGLLFGAKGNETTAQVADIVRSVVDIDPATAEGAAAAVELIKGNPEAAQTLQHRLAELHLRLQAEANREADQQRQDAIEHLKTELADVASARSQTVDLARSHSPLAYSSAILSAIILVGFAVMLFVVVNKTKAEALDSPLANVLLGTLAAMATQVANYWLGSSSGSAAKNTALASAQSALALSVPQGAIRRLGS